MYRGIRGIQCQLSGGSLHGIEEVNVKSELLFQLEAEAQSRPSGMEFEMAYQARIAIDRIKLAVKQSEQAENQPDQIREAGLLLLDALDRLQSVERRFQPRSRRNTSDTQESGRDVNRSGRSNGKGGAGIGDVSEPTIRLQRGKSDTQS